MYIEQKLFQKYTDNLATVILWCVSICVCMQENE